MTNTCLDVVFVWFWCSRLFPAHEVLRADCKGLMLETHLCHLIKEFDWMTRMNINAACNSKTLLCQTKNDTAFLLWANLNRNRPQSSQDEAKTVRPSSANNTYLFTCHVSVMLIKITSCPSKGACRLQRLDSGTHVSVFVSSHQGICLDSWSEQHQIYAKALPCQSNWEK